MGVRATEPAEVVAQLAADHWPRIWRGCDAAGGAADVLARLDAATAAWKLADVHVCGGGVVALVCGATSRGRDVVVKLGPRVAGSDELAEEGDALAFWRSTGAVVDLLDRRDDGYTLKLERLRPGTRLEDAGLPPDDMLRVCGDLVRRVHAAGTPPGSFAHLADGDGARTWLRLLDDEPELRDELRALLAARDDDVLVHGDLHGRNILRDGVGWRMVDPQPVRADRHAEIQPLYEASLCLRSDRAGDRDLAERWLEAYTSAAGMDVQRARRFTVLRAFAGARRIAEQRNPSPLHLQLAAGLQRLAEALR